GGRRENRIEGSMRSQDLDPEHDDQQIDHNEKRPVKLAEIAGKDRERITRETPCFVRRLQVCREARRIGVTGKGGGSKCDASGRRYGNSEQRSSGQRPPTSQEQQKHYGEDKQRRFHSEQHGPETRRHVFTSSHGL